jgi:hypothetical protein
MKNIDALNKQPLDSTGNFLTLLSFFYALYVVSEYPEHHDNANAAALTGTFVGAFMFSMAVLHGSRLAWQTFQDECAGVTLPQAPLVQFSKNRAQQHAHDDHALEEGRAKTYKTPR